MESLVALQYGALATLGGAILVYYGGSRLQPVYHILTNDPIPVRDLRHRDGPVEIEGTAQPSDGRTVQSPFTRTHCLAYEYEAQEHRSSGQHGSWVSLDEGAVAVPFLVADRTGEVEVDATRATLDFEEWQLKLSGGERPPPSIAQYVRRSEDVEPQHDKTVDLVVTELNHGNSQRFIERRLDVGEPVHVYGDVESAPAGEWGSNRVDARLADGEEAGLVVSDSSERGTAWQLARIPALFVGAGLVFLVPGLALLGFGLLSML